MEALERLAFIDVETTGFCPVRDHIAEIGVVTVDHSRIERWTTLVKVPSGREVALTRGVDESALCNAPRFADIATELAGRLAHRLIVAHNARFDHAFLREAFGRARIAYDPTIVCSVMLSRRLYPREAHHDLDSLIERHALRADVRHRALPDADVLWQWWQVIHRQWPHELIGKTIEVLLAGPVLPAHLDPDLIDRLPESPGVYVFHGPNGEALLTGAAGNLKLHVRNYFRIDRATERARQYSHRIANITWRATRGLLGARLHAAAVERTLLGAKSKRNQVAVTWQFSPGALPAVRVVHLPDPGEMKASECFGLFASERKGRNALVRLATRHRLCHVLLGISAHAQADCAACPVDQPAAGCVERTSRLRQLVRIAAALRPARLPRWAHHGPIGIRERTDLHVIDEWHFLGTAQNESDLYQMLERRPPAMDGQIYRLLSRTLARLPSRKILDLSRYGTAGPHSMDNSADEFSDGLRCAEPDIDVAPEDETSIRRKP